MDDWSAYFHRKFDTIAGENHIKPEDCLDLRPKFKLGKKFEKKPLSQAFDEKLLFITDYTLFGRFLIHLNAFDSKRLCLILDQINVAETPKVHKIGAIMKRAFLVLGR